MKQCSGVSPKICIVGAGPCGLTTAKNLLQHGLNQITVFEKNHRIGGNWYYSEDNQHSSVYETTHTISSRRLSEFEDFPMPPDYPDYPSHSQLLSYFEDYARHFSVDQYLRLNTRVERITRTDDQRWLVHYHDEAGEHDELFDYLMVANGHHSDPFLPEYKGSFQGEVLHSHAYKKAAPFKDKRVLVVGAGNSACDVAVEVSRVAAKTRISMRRGQHIFPKFVFGKPTDIAFATIKWMPFRLKQALTTFVIRIIQGRYAKYRLQKPDSKPLETHPTINSELLYFIRHGKIGVRPGIERMEGNTVYFTNGQCEDFDTVIFATGYKTTFPFFDSSLIEFSHATHIPLYRKMMHPDFDNLYFIGLFQPQGCIWPLADHQANIAASIIAGRLPRPDRLEMKIEQERQHASNRFKQTIRHALEVDYHLFRSQLKEELKS
ncbi:flavin-containing monooxygenase [Legionella sp. CNM-4043-24]|uniref:flavin-containing monooxygenase n=1 Tax=Legionella sp. CNM-4043-24 TaxID=3421646 RepID=UPI00403B298F